VGEDVLPLSLKARGCGDATTDVPLCVAALD